MTGHALARAVRSLYYRQHLAETIPTIEGTIRAELASRQLASARIGGFFVRFKGGSLSIEPTASVHPGQLKLPEPRGTQPPSAPITDRHLRR